MNYQIFGMGPQPENAQRLKSCLSQRLLICQAVHYKSGKMHIPPKPFNRHHWNSSISSILSG